MAHRILWNERCPAFRSGDGQPCQAWAIRGGYVCRVHGGAAPQVRAAARDRLELAMAWRRFMSRNRVPPAWLLAVRPEVDREQALAWQAQVRERLTAFRREHGRRPRKAELDWLTR